MADPPLRAQALLQRACAQLLGCEPEDARAVQAARFLWRLLAWYLSIPDGRRAALTLLVDSEREVNVFGGPETLDKLSL